MTKIYLDAAMRTKLLDFSQPLELCDENGNILGRLTPMNGPQSPSHRQPPLSEEELQRREEGPEYTTQEVIAYLEKL